MSEVRNQHSEQVYDLANVEQGLKGCDAVFPHDEYRAYQGLRDWASLLVEDRKRLEEQFDALVPARDALWWILDGRCKDAESVLEMVKLAHAGIDRALGFRATSTESEASAEGNDAGPRAASSPASRGAE